MGFSATGSPNGATTGSPDTAYNEQSGGLGYEFAAEVKRTMARILQFPDAWASLSPRTRRCRTRRFPCGVVYQVRGDLLLIVAVMHLRRHPDSWRSRMGSAGP